jgi:predicted SprT family Zn-dependent metalloprotease
MSKHKYVKEMERELHRINEIIDFKILHGLVYREETRQHKKLMSQIGALRSQRSSSFNLFSMLF